MPIGKLTRKQSEKRDMPEFNSEDVSRQLRRFSREPFMDVLVTFLAACPDAETVRLWATKHPHLWAQALRGISSIAGFTEKREVSHHHHVNISNMSDSDIEDQLNEMRQLLDGTNTLIANPVVSQNALDRMDEVQPDPSDAVDAEFVTQKKRRFGRKK